MSLDIINNKGCPLERQKFTWRDMVRKPISKLNDDAFTRVRVILMNGLESGALRFKHIAARFNNDLRLPLAEVRRSEQHQQTMVNWLLPPDQSLIETTIGYEQVAIEVTASVALHEPDSYLAQVYRFGMLEDFDHLYRFSALLDRLEGKDSNSILQSYTDVMPGRPTAEEHRAPQDDLRNHYQAAVADPLSKIHALTIVEAEFQTHDYYMTIGPTFADPVARQLYAEIASIEEQHVTQYGSLVDPTETWLEKWLLHEAMEVYNYYSCMQQETNTEVRAIWERFLDYELGHMHLVADLMKKYEKRDPMSLLPQTLPEPLKFESHRQFVRQVLKDEVDLRADGPNFVPKDQESSASLFYRQQLNSQGSPSEIVSSGYVWAPGTELARRMQAVSQRKGA